MSKISTKGIFKHFILTRFNVVKLSKEAEKSWLKHRFKIFSEYCYPSVRGQSCQNFKWLIFYGADTPEVFRRKVEKYSKGKNIIPVYIKGNELLNEAKRVISDCMGNDTQYLITTRIDTDDAISKDFIERIQNEFDNQKCEFINFTNGYVLTKNGIYLDKQPSNPFITLIEEAEGFKTVWCEEHNKLSRIGPIMQIESNPAWLQVVHTTNLSNKARGVLQPPNAIKYVNNHFVIRKNIYLFYFRGWVYFILKLGYDKVREIRCYIMSRIS